MLVLVLLVGLTALAVWQAVRNYLMGKEALERFGAFPPRGMPNYWGRAWFWIAIAVLGGGYVFSELRHGEHEEVNPDDYPMCARC